MATPKSLPNLLFSSYNAILLLTLLSTVSCSLGNACPIANSSCAGIQIQPPFSITQGCGDPTYALQCDQNKALYLWINSHPYQIQGIDYEFGTILLEDIKDPAFCKNLRESIANPSELVAFYNDSTPYAYAGFRVCTKSSKLDFPVMFPFLCRSSFPKTSCAIDALFYGCGSDPTHCCSDGITEPGGSYCAIYYDLPYIHSDVGDVARNNLSIYSTILLELNYWDSYKSKTKISLPIGKKSARFFV